METAFIQSPCIPSLEGTHIAWFFVFFFVFFSLKNLFIYFWLHWVLVAALGLSLVIANYGYSLVAVCGLLIVEASFVVAHRLSFSLAC